MRHLLRTDDSRQARNAGLKKGSGTVAGTARRVLRKTVPDPFLNSSRIWRMTVIALGTLILCSCRGPIGQEYGLMPSLANNYPGMPTDAFTGQPPQMAFPAGAVVMGPPGMEAGVPLPQATTGPWAPPGMSQPWPRDEYLADGGDEGFAAVIGSEWEVRGLEVEDTIAHYDTLDGETVVEPSNRVHIYSPRFGAIRQVVSLRQNETDKHVGGIHAPLRLEQNEETQIVQSRQQHVQPEGQTVLDLANIMRTEQGGGIVSAADGVLGYHYGCQPYEDLAAIRQGIFEAPEMARLAEGVDAAVAWGHHQAVQVVLDNQSAAAEVSDEKVSTLFVVKAPPGEARLRITKVASTQTAEPGESIAFTLRFDNVGTQMIGNVTVIDNLSTRLEYIPETAQCSRDAKFVSQTNEGDSLSLRWEITDPLPPGEGGIIRFHCRVR